ncbi:hypothetical protein SUGI_1010840 [Cryptomeria japonica]|nr:hypothetical protein SUGI_1010840 [Cryptomeria japonica]
MEEEIGVGLNADVSSASCSEGFKVESGSYYSPQMRIDIGYLLEVSDDELDILSTLESMFETAMRMTYDMLSIEQKTTSQLDFDQDELLNELTGEYKLLEALARIGDIYPINLSSDLSLDATTSDSIESQNAQWAHGEFFIHGLNVTMGHRDNLEANKTAFQFGWFRTRDICCLKKLWEEVRKTVCG